MPKPKKAPMTAAQKMLASKRRLVARLEGAIADIRDDADVEIAKVKGRIRIAHALIEALEKGTLNP